VPKFKILENAFNHIIETSGVTPESYRLSIDEKLANEINAKYKLTYSVDDLEKAANECIALKWIKRTTYGELFTMLQITPEGVNAARLKAESDKQKATRSWWKKLSDYIEDHKGLFTVLAFLLALITLASKFF
jgi:hypothetical protein